LARQLFSWQWDFICISWNVIAIRTPTTPQSTSIGIVTMRITSTTMDLKIQLGSHTVISIVTRRSYTAIRTFLICITAMDTADVMGWRRWPEGYFCSTLPLGEVVVLKLIQSAVSQMYGPWSYLESRTGVTNVRIWYLEPLYGECCVDRWSGGDKQKHPGSFSPDSSTWR
jgi:hypothetical protein